MKLLLATIALAAAALLPASLSGASSAARTTHAGARLLPAASFEPTKLQAARYRTRLGFAPLTTFTVGAGWYGNQGSARDWGVGKGLNRAEQRWAYGAILVDVLRLSFAKAVSTFRGISGLTVGRSTPTRIGGYAGVTFHAKLKGSENVPLTALGISADITDIAGQQTFLNVRGKILLIRTEHGSPTAPAAVQTVLRTFQFPRH